MDTPAPLFPPQCARPGSHRAAPFLPMSRAEMDVLGWDVCDVVLVTGDAYVDHPSFGMALIGRLLEAHGFRVGIIAQPDWQSADAFKVLGRPRLFFGVTSGNMDSMVNRYTSDGPLRHNDSYTPGDEGGKRPDRAVIVYAQRAREAFRDVPIVLGGIEASLRRIAHYDYWSDKVRRSVLADAKADILLYGNAERAVVEVAHRLAAGEAVADFDDIRGVVLFRKTVPEGWREVRADDLEPPGRSPSRSDEHPVVRLPSYEQVEADREAYARAARASASREQPRQCPSAGAAPRRPRTLADAAAHTAHHAGTRCRLRPAVCRAPHPSYGSARIPAWEMIRFSITIMRGCFGGCSFCSITEHEGRVIQSRSEASILKEIEAVRDKTGWVHRRHLRPRRADREHVPHAVHRCSRRSAVQEAVLRLSRHLQEPGYQP